MTTPLKTNARKLIGVLVQHFPSGGTSEDLRRGFERETSLVRQSFYNALSYAKQQGWIVGGGRDQPYNLNPDCSWKEPVTSIGESLEKDRLEYLVGSQTQQIESLQDKVERLLDWSNGGDAGVALPSLVKIVGDDTASTRQRLRAAAAVLAYKVADNEVTAFVKRFLESVCTSTDIGNVDYKIEAGELLRKYEAPRIASESVKPSYSDDGANRIEAWRTYERWALKKEIVLETRDPPLPGWDDHLLADTYKPPEGTSMPPVRVVTDPTSGFRLLDNLMPGPGPRRIGNDADGADDDTAAS